MAAMEDGTPVIIKPQPSPRMPSGEYLVLSALYVASAFAGCPCFPILDYLPMDPPDGWEWPKVRGQEVRHA